MQILEGLRGLDGNEAKRSYLASLQLPVTIKHTDKFYAFFLDLGLSANGQTLDIAYNNLLKAKADYFDDLVNSSGEDLIRYPGPKKLPKLLEKPLLMTAIKSLVAGLVFGIIVSLFLVGSVKKVVYEIDRLDQRVYMAMKGDNAKKEERLERFKKKLQVAKPYIKEVKKVFNEE